MTTFKLLTNFLNAIFIVVALKLSYIHDKFLGQKEMDSVFIVDNGSYSIKAGYKDDLKPKIIPNYIFKTSSESYVGREIDNCPEPSNLYLNSPFERGYLVHMDVQNEIWQDIFGRRQFGLNFSDTKLVLTDSNLTVPTIETSVREILFETYGFHSLQLASAPGLIARYHYERTKIPHSLIVDSGHSFTHILPCLSGKICVERSMRIDVGGKIMTNFLRDKLTYSQYDLRQETKVVNEMKEDVCYFAKDFRQEMELFKRNNPVIDYYLPDHNLLRRGQIKRSTDPAAFKDLSTIALGVERFVLPETIFFPEITDCDQIGLKEAINRTCNGVFNYNLFGRYMLKNIIVFGGNAAIPGLKQRLCHDLSNAFEAYDVPENIESCINVSETPIIEPWLAAQYLTNYVPSFSEKFVSKKEYQEYGNRICDERFSDYAPKEWYEQSEGTSFVDENGLPITDSEDELFETARIEPAYNNPPQKIHKPIEIPEPIIPEHVPTEITAPSISTPPTSNIVIIQEQQNNEIIPQNIVAGTPTADTDIIEIDYIPTPPRPLIRPLLRPRRTISSVPIHAGRPLGPPGMLQKVVVPQRLIRRQEPGLSSNVQYYTALPEGSGPSRFVHLRPTRFQSDILQHQQQHRTRLPILPSTSIIRIRNPSTPVLSIRSAIQQQPSEMPILRPQIARTTVPIMLPRGMLTGSGAGATFRGRTIVVRRAIPRSQYVPLHQHQPQQPQPPHHPQHPQSQSVVVQQQPVILPSTNFQHIHGLEEEYESGESGPSTPL